MQELSFINIDGKEIAKTVQLWENTLLKTFFGSSPIDLHKYTIKEKIACISVYYIFIDKDEYCNNGKLRGLAEICKHCN